jgi:hypothetical protein
VRKGGREGVRFPPVKVIRLKVSHSIEETGRNYHRNIFILPMTHIIRKSDSSNLCYF